jgi:hypothetical protein
MKIFGSDKLIQATGGSTLSLARNRSTLAMKVDAGSGPAVFVDPGGALFNGLTSWKLEEQWEWAVFLWDADGGAWDVFAHRASMLRNSKAASSAAEPSPQPSTR